MTIIRTKTSLTMEAARKLVDAAIDAARKRGLSIAVAVVDSEGAPLALMRMDGVPAPIAGFAQDKAYTAAVTGQPSRQFGEHMTSSKAMSLGLAGRPHFLVWGGGVPARHDGAVVGGIGVSGGPEDEDIACATQALELVGLG